MTLLPEDNPYNPNLTVLAYYIDIDEPMRRMSIGDVIGQIAEMDTDPELRNGHIAGLLAARLSLEYQDTQMYPVHEKVLDVGTLAMLGCYITECESLTPTEMDHAETYQRTILYTRVLDDFKPEQTYALRTHPSAASHAQARIRLNKYGYQDGRAEFSRTVDDMVVDYRNFIHAIHPTGERIAAYREDAAIMPLVERFSRTRRSLLRYTSELAAQEPVLWRYARAHYAHYIAPCLVSSDDCSVDVV